MNHPKDRCERRSVRDGYIKKRKNILIRRPRSWYEGPEAEDRHPYDHEPQWDWDKYYNYQEWLTLSDDDKKVKEVQAILDRKEFEEPTWKPIQWGVYAKYYPLCTCLCCKHEGRFDRISGRTKNRSEQVRRSVKDSIG